MFMAMVQKLVYLAIGNIGWYIYVKKAILRISIILDLSRYSCNDWHASFSCQYEIIILAFSSNPEVDKSH